MKRRFSIALVSIAAAAGIGAAVAPAASAAPIEPTPVVGSLSICWDVPIGPTSLHICF